MASEHFYYPQMFLFAKHRMEEETIGVNVFMDNIEGTVRESRRKEEAKKLNQNLKKTENRRMTREKFKGKRRGITTEKKKNKKTKIEN